MSVDSGDVTRRGGTHLSHEDLEEDLRLVALHGRLDMVGVEEIAIEFASLTAGKPRRVIVDLTDVSFLASIGIRSIIESARAQEIKGGHLVIVVGDNPVVRASIDATGIGTIVPVLSSDAEARQALSA